MKLPSATSPVHPKVIWSGALTLSFGVIVYEVEKYSHYKFDGTETAFLTAILGIGVGYFKSAPVPLREIRVVTVESPSLEAAPEDDNVLAAISEHGLTPAPRAPEWGKTA